MRMLDLFCGRGGWTDAFLARGWECFGVDLVRHQEYRGYFIEADVLDVKATERYISIGNQFFFGRHNGLEFDFICASSPCEQFSVHGLRCFYPNPPHPELGLRLFNHTRDTCEASGVPYVMENVRAAQQFAGKATHRCGPFYLWGTGVPPLMPQGIQKGMRLGKSGYTGEAQKEWRRKLSNPSRNAWSGSETRSHATAKIATIPPELANCVADYAERLVGAAA